MPEAAFAGIDLGAESGRVVVGRLEGGRASVEVIHRFANRPVRLPDGLHWNLLSLFGEALAGLRRATQDATLSGVGVDAWGVDYALLDESGRVLGLPFHYRDLRTSGMVARAHSRVPRDELYAATGIQTMPINTVFQLLADEGSPALAAAERIALVPDLFAFWLSGEFANEATIASTTGLLDARSGMWAGELIDRLGLPPGPFTGTPVEPGTTLGPLLQHHGGRHSRARGRGPRHRVRIRGGPASHAARGGSLIGDVVTAWPRARRAGADARSGCVQPHERARCGRNDPVAAQRDGPLAGPGVQARLRTRVRRAQSARGGGARRRPAL